MDFFISEIGCQARSLSFPHKIFKNLFSNERNPQTRPRMLSVIHAMPNDVAQGMSSWPAQMLFSAAPPWLPSSLSAISL